MKPPPPELEFANIPGVRARDLASRIQSIAIQMRELAAEHGKLREKLAGLVGFGRYENMTVYKVDGTFVKRHWREGYKAIRARVTR